MKTAIHPSPNPSPNPSPLGLTSDAVRIWQHLRRDGGWWSADDLHRHWYPTFAREALQQMLDYLSEHGFALRRVHIGWGVPLWAVTATCRAVPGHEAERQEKRQEYGDA